jgi:hypothetical protein
MGTVLTVAVGMVIAFLFLTVLAERTTEQTLRILPFLDHRTLWTIPTPMLVALFWALVFSWGADLNFFVMLGFSFRWPLVGFLVTAILMTGGSNLVHSIIKSYFTVTRSVSTDPAGAFTDPDPPTMEPSGSNTIPEQAIVSGSLPGG